MNACICVTACLDRREVDGLTDDTACTHCESIDIYDPCPVTGFGCFGDCDCCTPEQKVAVGR